jgi:hypothetical protein
MSLKLLSDSSKLSERVRYLLFEQALVRVRS